MLSLGSCVNYLVPPIGIIGEFIEDLVSGNFQRERRHWDELLVHFVPGFFLPASLGFPRNSSAWC